MANQTNYAGLWIPIDVLTDEKLSYKEKLILSMIIFQSSNNNKCATSNQSFGNIFNISANRVWKIISSLKDKKYMEVNFLYKDNGKEIIKRTIVPIGNNNNNPIGTNDNKDCQKEQVPIGETDKVNKYINNYKNNYNNFGTNNKRSKPSWQSYDQREYPEGYFDQFYANAPNKTISENAV